MICESLTPYPPLNVCLLTIPHSLEVIECAERIEQILPRLDEMVDGGLITLEKVRVILYRPAKK